MSLLKMTKFRQSAAPINWILALAILVLIFFAVFECTWTELGMLMAVDLFLLNPVVGLIDGKVYPWLYPESRLFFDGPRHEEIARLDVRGRRELLTAMTRFPGRRALYGVVYSFLCKVPPAVALIVVVWHHDVPVATQTLKTILTFSLLYAFFAAQMYVENHELVSETIADLHARYDWSEVFRDFTPPLTKHALRRSEMIGVVVVWVLVVAFQILVTWQQRHVGVPLYVQNAAIAGVGLAVLTRTWSVHRRFLYGGLEKIFQVFADLDFSRGEATISLHSSPSLARFEQTCNRLAERLRRAEHGLAATIVGEAEKYRFHVVGEVSALITHDLAAPLSTIHFCAETGLRAPEKLAERRYVEQLYENTRHAMELVESLRAYLKDPTGQSSTTLAEAHRHVLRLLGFQAHHVLVDAIRLADPEGAAERPLAFPRSNLIQVLLNLYSNALANLDEHAVPGPSVVVTATSAAGAIEVLVADNGTGLTAERFETMTATGLLAGAGTREGLGLRLTRRLVEHYGGSLELVPAAQGTTLKLRLRAS